MCVYGGSYDSARCVFVVRRHTVFEVEDDDVNIQRQGLGDHGGVVARDE